MSMSDEPQVATRLSSEEEFAASFAQPAGGALATLGHNHNQASEVITARKVEVKRQHDEIMREIATLAKVAGSAWFYSFPAKNEDGTRSEVSGPSVKCTDEIARLYGNCRQVGHAIDQGDHFMIRASFTDFERGYVLERDFFQMKRAIGLKTKSGRGNELALQIGISKAMRNVIHHALRTYVDFAFEEARASFVDEIGKRIDHYRDRALERLDELGVDKVRVEKQLGRAAANWVARDIAKVVAQIQAIRDGMATIEDTWPAAEGASAEPRPTRDSVAAKEEAHVARQTGEDTDAAADEAGFHVGNFVGEVASYTDARDAFGSALAALREAAKARGRDGVVAFAEANEGLIVAFIEAKRRDLADQLTMMIEALLEQTNNQDSARNPEPSSDTSASPGESAERPGAEPRTAASGRGNKRASGHKGPERSPEGIVEGAPSAVGWPSGERGDERGDSATSSRGVAEREGGSDRVEARPPVDPTESKTPPEDWGSADRPAAPAENAAAATSTERSPTPSATGNESPRPLKVEMPIRQDRSINWQILRDMLMDRADQFSTKEDLDRFAAANQDAVDRLRAAYPNYAQAVLDRWNKERVRLGEAQREAS